MKRSTGIGAPSVRVHAGAPAGIAALVAVAGMAMPASAAPWHWNALGGSWSTANKWAPAVVPSNGADVFIGSTAVAENATVVLDLDRELASLTITDGMTAHNTQTAWYDVAGDTVVSGKNIVPGPFGLLTEYPSRLLLNGVDGLSLRTHDLVLADGGRAVLDWAFVRVLGMTTIDAESRMQGHGVVDSSGDGVKLRNDGTIRATNTEVPLRFRQFDAGTYDLDGISGNGVLDLQAVTAAEMRFDGTSLADSFSGTILMSPGARLTMDLSDGWTADAGSVIEMETTPLYEIAMIDGQAMTLGGTVHVSGPGGWLNLEMSELVLTPSVRVNVAANNALTIGTVGDTSTTVEGGEYHLDGSMRFDGPTTMRGGAFTTDLSHPGTSKVRAFGATAWDGDVTIDGQWEQFGDATVIGPSTINAVRFDMSAGAATSWQINHALTIKADALTVTGGMDVSSDIAIGGGLFSRLTMDLADGPWVHTGALDLTGNAAFFVDRIAGSGYELHGALTLPSGRAGISADIVIGASASVSLTSASSELRLTGDTWVQTAEFLGSGTLLNGPMGVMTLSNGLSMDSVGFVNQGEFEIGIGEGLISAGLASMDRFENQADAVWSISLGGHAAGAEHDLLMVTGGETHLDGLMHVDLADLGGGTFLPSMGDEFLVLVSLGAISGTFANDPLTHFNGVSYEWSVVYTPHTVSLRLDGIVPAPGALALAGLTGLPLARRIRR